MTLVPLERVQARVLGRCHPLGPLVLPLEQALGRVTAAAVVADQLVPPFANTAMDGYALRAADTTSPPSRLQVVGILPAGAAPTRAVGPGQAVRIMTGAPIPPGADAVVMVERTSSPDGGATVVVEVAARPGDHVRAEGDDLRPGDVVVEAGTELSPGHLGVLASLGRLEVEAFPPARVGVLSTGDELVEGPAPLRPGQIRDSNRHVLLALVRQAGCVPVDLGRVGDDESAIAAVIEQALAGCHALVTSGGVSVGDFDHVQAVLGRLGEAESWQVAIKPAKPLSFGVVGSRPVFGLPGNPVSSAVSFELFARPALRRMMGHPEPFRVPVPAVADEPLTRKPDGKLHLVRVSAGWGDDGRLRVRSSGGQGSHVLGALARADALALLPDGEGVHEGERVEVLLLS